MQELHLIAAESTATSLVFQSVDDPDQQYFLAVDESTRTALRLAIDSEDSSPTTPALDATEAAETEAPAAEDTPAAPVSDTEELADAPSEEPAPAPTKLEPRPVREVDPRLSSPLKDSPRQIQERIRAGASIAEVAADNEVTESRIEPYAHPILLERARIAEMAKQAHPVRDDGPARLSLWEVLATAFAARGQNLQEATWDAYKETAGQWVVTLAWNTGHSSNLAEWSYHRSATATPTAIARNGIAAELIDPEAPMNQRGLSAVNTGISFGAGRFNQEDDLTRISGAGQETLEDTREDLPVIKDEPKSQQPTAEGELVGEDFLQHPKKPAAKKKRKAVTPHWEDVLLGVRANTQRPRDGK